MGEEQISLYTYTNYNDSQALSAKVKEKYADGWVLGKISRSSETYYLTFIKDHSEERGTKLQEDAKLMNVFKELYEWFNSGSVALNLDNYRVEKAIEQDRIRRVKEAEIRKKIEEDKIAKEKERRKNLTPEEREEEDRIAEEQRAEEIRKELERRKKEAEIRKKANRKERLYILTQILLFIPPVVMPIIVESVDSGAFVWSYYYIVWWGLFTLPLIPGFFSGTRGCMIGGSLPLFILVALLLLVGGGEPVLIPIAIAMAFYMIAWVRTYKRLWK